MSLNVMLHTIKPFFKIKISFLNECFFYCSDVASPAHIPGTPESHKTENTESGEPTESTKSPTGTCVHVYMYYAHDCTVLYIFHF